MNISKEDFLKMISERLKELRTRTEPRVYQRHRKRQNNAHNG